MDTFGWCDGFIKINYCGAENQTEVGANSAKPDWLEVFTLSHPNE